MKKNFKLLTLIFVITMLLQFLFALPVLAASKITTETGECVENSKLVLKVIDEQIKPEEVEAIYISIGTDNTTYVDGVLEREKNANPKVIVSNSLFYRIYDGYIKLEFMSANDVARKLGNSTEDIKVDIVLTKGRKLEITGKVTGVFESSTTTPSTGSDENGKYLFKDYQYTSSTEPGGWAYEQVKSMKAKDIVKGTTEGYLFPDAKITLKEFIAMLSRTLQYMNKADNTNSNKVYNIHLVDNQYDSWVKDDYSVLMNAFAVISDETTDKGKEELTKVLTGMENLNSMVTRQEAAVMMAAFLGDCSNAENPDAFLDWNNVNNNFKGRVARLCEFGVMYGTQESNGLYIHPTTEIKRVEALVLLSKFIELKDEIKVKSARQTEEEITANDTTCPIITFTPNGGTVKPNADILFNVTDLESDITTIRYSWDNAIATSIYSINQKTYSKTLDVPNEVGKHTLRVWAKNEGGQVTGWKKVTYIVDKNAAEIDTTAPDIKFFIGGKEVGIFTMIDPNAKEVIIKAEDTQSGVEQIAYYWDSNVETVVNGNTVTVALPDNTDVIHYLHARAKNRVGIWSEDRYLEYKNLGTDYNTDNTPPIITINTNLTQISTKDNIAITVRDPESGVGSITYRWDSNSDTVVFTDNVLDITIIAKETPQTEGTHTLYIKAKNGEGDETSEQRYTFTIVKSNTPLIPGTQIDIQNDTTAPVVSIDTTISNLSMDDLVKVTAQDLESGVVQLAYRWDSNNDTIKAWRNFTILKTTIEIPVPHIEGQHTLYVKAQNGKGIWSQEISRLFNINKVNSDLTDDPIDSPVKVIIGGDEDDGNVNDGETGNVVEPGTELIITGEKPDEIVEIGYHWNDEPEIIIKGSELKIKIPEEVGIHYLYVRVKNKNGVWSAVRKYKFEVVKDLDDVKVKEAIVVIKNVKDDANAFSKVYPWDDIDNNKITIKAPTKKGTYMLYVRVVNNNNNIIEAKDSEFKIKEDDDESNLVKKTKLPKTKLTVELTKDGEEAEDAGMVTYPGNPELIGALNPKVTSLRVELRNVEEKLMFEPEEEIKYYIDFYNGSSKKVNDVKIVLNIPEGFKGVSASNDGSISKDKITWEIGNVKEGGGDRYTAVIKYVDDFKEDVLFVPELDILTGKDLQDTSFVYNVIYKSGVSNSGYHYSYVVGYPDGTFQPQGTITRAEMAAMCANLFGLTAYDGSAFLDLSYDHWANSAINGCVAAGLIDSYGEYFDPNSPASRAIFAIALARQLGVADIEPIFINASDTEDHYAMKEMEQLIRLGLVEGYPDGTAGPNNLVTRAEAVTMLNKYAFRGGLTLSNYSNYGNSYVFTDLSNGHWALNQILEAALDHSYTRTTNGEEQSY